MSPLSPELLPAESWARLYNRYGREVRDYFVTQTGSPHDADDLVQDVFAGLLRRGKLPRNVRIYIYAAARNRLRRYWRERMKGAGTTRTEATDDVTGASSDVPGDRESDPLNQLMQKETRGSIACALSRIPASLAKAVELRFVAELSPKEAAHELGCTQAALKKRLQRAKRLVAECCRRRDMPFQESPSDASPPAVKRDSHK
jgi:RNA polymerase sigma-70 factor (ECF subfamily)